MQEKSRSYKLEVVTPARMALSQEVIFTVILTGAGPIGVMPEHAPLLGIVFEGKLSYRDLERQDHQMQVGDGFLMVSREGVSIVARTAEQIS